MQKKLVTKIEDEEAKCPIFSECKDSDGMSLGYTDSYIGCGFYRTNERFKAKFKRNLWDRE